MSERTENSTVRASVGEIAWALSGVTQAGSEGKDTLVSNLSSLGLDSTWRHGLTRIHYHIHSTGKVTHGSKMSTQQALITDLNTSKSGLPPACCLGTLPFLLMRVNLCARAKAVDGVSGCAAFQRSSSWARNQRVRRVLTSWWTFKCLLMILTAPFSTLVCKVRASSLTSVSSHRPVPRRAFLSPTMSPIVPITTGKFVTWYCGHW